MERDGALLPPPPQSRFGAVQPDNGPEGGFTTLSVPVRHTDGTEAAVSLRAPLVLQIDDALLRHIGEMLAPLATQLQAQSRSPRQQQTPPPGQNSETRSSGHPDHITLPPILARIAQPGLFVKRLDIGEIKPVCLPPRAHAPAPFYCDALRNGRREPAPL